MNTVAKDIRGNSLAFGIGMKNFSGHNNMRGEEKGEGVLRNREWREPGLMPRKVNPKRHWLEEEQGVARAGH